MVPVPYLRTCLFHNPVTGAVVWRVRPRSHFATDGAYQSWNTKYAGTEAGIFNARGYRVFTLRIDGQCHKLLAHRAAWALMHGHWPAQSIDHINHDRRDNRLANLRDVSHLENMRNRAWRPAAQRT